MGGGGGWFSLSSPIFPRQRREGGGKRIPLLLLTLSAMHALASRDLGSGEKSGGRRDKEGGGGESSDGKLNSRRAEFAERHFLATAESLFFLFLVL